MWFLTPKDILLVLLFSFIFTWIITNISNIFRVVINNPTEFDYETIDLTKIQRKCYKLFPKEDIKFDNKIFVRGNCIKVKTYSNNCYEGIFMGLNNENVICILTRSHIIAHRLDSIENILLLEEEKVY